MAESDSSRSTPSTTAPAVHRERGRTLRILLVQPAPFEPGRLGLENITWLSEPVALTSLAAMVPEHEVRILDMRLEPDIVLNEVLCQMQPDLVGTTAMTTDAYQAKAVLEMARQTLGPDCFTIVGGHHPTLSPELYQEEPVDAVALGEGEETFAELVAHLARGRDRRDLGAINGLCFRDRDGRYQTTPKRHQNRDLDTFPAPARHLIPRRYRDEYFFMVANPMASLFTSRGCSYNCNFCAIWEFYERRTRYMSARTICDRLETIEERFAFFLDDNFLTSKQRLNELCEEIQRRGIKKYWGTQGRSDFIAQNPEMMEKLRDAGLTMVLSGYETNDDDALESLRKANTLENNQKAAEMMRNLGMLSCGIFMVRPEFEARDFDLLYQTINEMGVAIPLVTILTPLPGTELWRKRRHELLTEDVRLFDLLHSVLPTKLPREEFYARYTSYNQATWPSFQAGILAALRRRPDFFAYALPGILRFVRKAHNYRPVYQSAESHLRDEIGIIAASGAVPPRPLASLAALSATASAASSSAALQVQP